MAELIVEPLTLATIYPRADGFVYPHEAADAMCTSEEEVVGLARQGALEVRGAYVRPALVGWIAVRA